MKIERLRKPGYIWPWLKTNLPQSLVAYESTGGYATICEVYRRGEEPKGKFSFRFEPRDPVARVSNLRVELLHPEYVSDFESLCQKFEAETRYEPTLVYWESP